MRLLLERLDRHDSAPQAASENEEGITTSARSALSKIAARLSLPAEMGDPARFLFAVRTYYGIIVKLATWSIVEGTACTGAPQSLSVSHRNLEQFETGHVAAGWGVEPFPESPASAWYLDLWDRPLARWLQRVVDHLRAVGSFPPSCDPLEGHDLFGQFYMSLFPKQVRHSLGEHYTPPWLADRVLDQVGFDGTCPGRLLDPACGSGVFLLRALYRLRCYRKNAASDREVERIVGMDVSPVAVLTARANYLLALRDYLDSNAPVALPVHLRDVILSQPTEPGYDFLVGNPPWLVWDHLPDDYRRQTKSHWKRYGLFSLSGNEARHGGGKKDLAMLVLYTGADRYLRDGGRLGMVVTQTLFQTRGAGDGFRRFRLGENGTPLKVLCVDDLVDVQPFETAANWTATIALEKGVPTTYPVPYVRWTRKHKLEPASRAPGLSRFTSQALEAQPIDADRPQSPWFVRPAGLRVRLEDLIGPSDYAAHLGVNTGGANGVYWFNLIEKNDPYVEAQNLPGRGKQTVETVRTLLEPDLLYPLVRWCDVARYHAVASTHVLLAQDPSTRRGIDEPILTEKLPKTYAYLKRFESHLRRRAAYRRYQDSAPFYSMYNVGTYSVARYKVVWRRMDRVVRAAVLQPVDDPLLGRRTVVCQETCAMIAAGSPDEAHYLAALLNSAVVGFLVQAHNVRGGKGFGSPGMLEYLRVRQFDGENPKHRELSQLGRTAHCEARAGGKSLRSVQQAIDTISASLYGLTPSEARSLAKLVEQPESARGAICRNES